MYFEDIIKKTYRYWLEPIENGRVGEFYTSHIEDNYLEGDDQVKDWIDVLNWSIAIVLTEYEENYKEDFLTINMLLIRSVEERFKYDLKNQLTNELLKNYKGFKNLPGKNQKITEKYLDTI